MPVGCFCHMPGSAHNIWFPPRHARHGWCQTMAHGLFTFFTRHIVVIKAPKKFGYGRPPAITPSPHMPSPLLFAVAGGLFGYVHAALLARHTRLLSACCCFVWTTSRRRSPNANVWNKERMSECKRQYDEWEIYAYLFIEFLRCLFDEYARCVWRCFICHDMRQKRWQYKE